MLFLLPVYFLAAVCISAWLIFPALRATTLRGLRACLHGLRRGVARSTERAGGHLGGGIGWLANGYARVTRGVSGYVKSHRWQTAAVLAVVSLPTLFAFLMRHNHTFVYEPDLRNPSVQIEALLAGERLVPPPPVPPEAFTTAEVVMIRPNIVTASRDWDLLDPDFRQRLLLAYQIMRDQYGYQMALIEGYRSPERQQELRDKDGPAVTNAGAYQSYHQYGLAADNAFLRDGKIVISEKDPWALRGYQLYGEVAERVGLTWGGRWKLMDFGHVEYRKPGIKLGMPPPR
ncbi:M15 family metallopeptidase [Achromobacter aloeverae]|uniref:D-alanyl-D-alanine carboxypeptidase n=1 Tax=Achromobacter aloeverae TaxID=1750518 RepID=A0A4Q1HIW6_9BURK|nr:M15 family metallopeptidase [Achromobacter aloeverae]RXN86216.1 D-alanyl-D-alanine carboxypeptidase [Achromobacter aloeverae]